MTFRLCINKLALMRRTLWTVSVRFTLFIKYLFIQLLTDLDNLPRWDCGRYRYFSIRTLFDILPSSVKGQVELFKQIPTYLATIQRLKHVLNLKELTRVSF